MGCVLFPIVSSLKYLKCVAYFSLPFCATYIDYFSAPCLINPSILQHTQQHRLMPTAFDGYMNPFFPFRNIN